MDNHQGEDLFPYLTSVTYDAKTLSSTIAGCLDILLGETGAEAAELFLLSPDHERSLLAIHRGASPRAFRQITQFAWGQGFPGLVAQSGEPLLSPDVSQDDRYLRPAVQQIGFHPYVCIPLHGNTGVLGSLHITSRHQLSIPAIWPLVQRAAAQIAFILELARFLAAESIAGEPLDTALNASANLQRQAQHIVQTLTRVGELEIGALLWLDERDGALRMLATQDAPPSVEHALLRACRDTSCPALARQHCMLPGDRERSSFPACRSVARELHASICLPLVIRGRPVGVMLMGSRVASFPPAHHLMLLQPTIERAAIALHNAAVAVYEEHAARHQVQMGPDAPAIPTADCGSGALALPSYAPAANRAGTKSPFLDLHCLGRFAVSRDGQPIPLDQFVRRRSITLLKILLTRYEKPAHRDELLELLWPEENPARTRSLLYVVVHHLRRALEPQASPGKPSTFIRALGDAYVFDVASPHRLDSQELLKAAQEGERQESFGHDAEAIRCYERVLALYDGDFLSEDRYSDWCALERGYLQEVFFNSIRRLTVLYLHSDNVTATINCCRHALRIDNTLEDLHSLVMRLLLREGRREEALRQYHECRNALQRELGVVPAPETETLYRSILTGSSASRPV
jgi:DNA-binding SARP family transcriptional activator